MTIGERLKTAREARKISIEEACRVTKIQRKTLEAIEQDRIDEMLDPAYARIFVKKYGAYLGVDGSAVLEAYSIRHSPKPEPALTVETEITRQQQKQGALSSLWGPLTAGFIAMVGIAFLVYLSVDLFRHLSSRSPAPARKPPSAAAPAARPAPPLVPMAKPLKLTLQTTADVWIQVKADGAVIFQNVLAKGAQESWTAQHDLELWTGNAGAMKLSLNGKPLEDIGRGVKKGIRITHFGVES